MDISEEKLQNMQINVDKLRKKQEKSAGDVAAARAEYETRKTTYIGSVRKLQERLGKSISSITEQSSVTEMDHVLENWKQQLEEELNKLKKDAKLLAKLREALQNIEEQRRKLRETYTQCMTEEKEAAEKLAGSEATLKNLKDSAEFQTEEAAKAALHQAVSSKQRAEETYQKVSAEAKEAVNSQKQAETLIGRYQQEIPTQKQCVEERKTSYIEIMSTKQMTEKEWKELAEAYSREAAEEFQKTVNTYYERKRHSRQGGILQRMQLGRSDGQSWKKFRRKEIWPRQNIWKQKRFIINCVWTAKTMERFWLLFIQTGRTKGSCEEHAGSMLCIG